MERKYHTYRYTNILNGMKYNGCTCKEQSRRAGKNGTQYVKKCPKFGEAIIEFGWPNFKYELLEEGLTKEEAYQKEKEHIKEDNSIWPNGYNLEGGGKKGKIVHPETCIKLSETSKSTPHIKGWHHSEEVKKKMSKSHMGVSAGMKGRHHTDDTKKKISEVKKGKKINQKGHPISEETRQKISLALRGRENNFSKGVLRYSKDGQLIAEYSSINEAARQTGIHCGNIGACCHGKLKSAGGYCWEFKQDN